MSIDGFKLPNDLAEQCLSELPDDWVIQITLSGGNARPYIELLDDCGDSLSDGPASERHVSSDGSVRYTHYETVEASVQRLLQYAMDQNEVRKEL